MKYRISQGQNSCDGSDIFRIYRVDGDVQVYLTAEGSLERARATLERLMNPQPEVMIEEHQA
jgi:hypothetical protein